MDGRSKRRTYTAAEKADALFLVREVGVTEASRRLGISPYTLGDWKAYAKACAYSPFVGRGRSLRDGEREVLLAQLVHEQQLEGHFERRKYRHNRETVGMFLRYEDLEVLLTRTGIVQRHLLEWADPVFDEVAARWERAA